MFPTQAYLLSLKRVLKRFPQSGDILARLIEKKTIYP